MRHSDRAVWAACGSLADLRAATVRWLRGEVVETSGHAGPPDPETADIVEDLVALNGLGLLTTGSQPGVDPVVGWDGREWSQRAFVDGYTAPELAAEIAGWCRGADLECHVEAVADMRGWGRSRLRGRTTYTAVTASTCGRVSAVCPRRLERADHDAQFGGVGDGAWAEVEASVRVTVIDLQWGARRELWDTLREALNSRNAVAS